MPLERRRHIRHKVHSPAYASIGAGVGGVVLDANERGAAIETVSQLAAHSFVDLRLDLLETRSSAVTPARVAWYDSEGRAGLEFLKLTGESRRQLQQWLLLNALLATENAGKLAPAMADSPARKPESPADPLRQAAAQALACTGGDGAAIALAENSVIVCRATAGEIAPPPGTKLDTQAGISGACVRSGRWLRCDDPRLDPHVDRESCQALGINSVLAVPIGGRGNILGLIEVFSRQAYAFNEGHSSALLELAKTIAGWLQPESAAPAASTVSKAEAAPPSEPESPAVSSAAPPPIPDNRGAEPPAIANAANTVLAPGESSYKLELGGVLRQRVILLAVLVAFMIGGLWLALDRGAGGAKNVDAAESPTSGSQSQEAPGSRQGNAVLPVTGSSAEWQDSMQALRQRAEAGDAEAAFELGARYASGGDVRQDYGEAVKWFKRAADGGQVLAAATLGAYYWAGRGVPQDDISAYMWSSIAKEGGDEASKYRIAILRARMTPTEVAQAEQRAAAWRQTHSSPPLVKETTQ